MQVDFSVSLRGDNTSVAGSIVKICSKPLSKDLIEYTILINSKFKFIGTCRGFNGACLGWTMEVTK